ncbi:hypothetical protein CE195_04270, partial [Sodalis-like symbiont of Philaenus spumarius]
ENGEATAPRCPAAGKRPAKSDNVTSIFCRIKQFRRGATRYDKLSKRFTSFVALTAAFIWLC